MKVQTTGRPVKFQPIEIKITFESEAEYNVFRVMTARDNGIPSMLEQEGDITDTEEVLLSRMLVAIHQDLRQVGQK